MKKLLIIILLIPSLTHAANPVLWKDAIRKCNGKLPTINQVKHLEGWHWTGAVCPRDPEFIYVAGNGKIWYTLKAIHKFKVKCK